MLSETKFFCACLTVSIFIPQAQSLKDKRMVVKSIKDKTRHDFNVAVAEVGDADKWQTAVLAFALVGNDSAFIEQAFAQITGLIETNYPAEICEREIRYL